MYRLPVGHTHCILDQRFGPIARFRKEKTCLSLFSYVYDIPHQWNDVQQRPHVIYIDGVYDWISFLTTDNRWCKVTNINDLRQYRFTRGTVYGNEFEPLSQTRITLQDQVALYYNNQPELKPNQWIGDHSPSGLTTLADIVNNTTTTTTSNITIAAALPSSSSSATATTTTTTATTVATGTYACTNDSELIGTSHYC